MKILTTVHLSKTEQTFMYMMLCNRFCQSTKREACSRFAKIG